MCFESKLDSWCVMFAARMLGGGVSFCRVMWRRNEGIGARSEPQQLGPAKVDQPQGAGHWVRAAHTFIALLFW